MGKPSAVRLSILMMLAALLVPSLARAETISVAVAANFTQTAEDLAQLFKAESGHDIRLSFGSTGQLYAQITQGAPFQVFLAADDERPARLVVEGWGVEGTLFTYALGALALYGASSDVSNGEAVLRAGEFRKLAIADPISAPYGQAAVETLQQLGLLEAVEPKLVTGENIGQTLQFVESGSAELGFVAASQIVGKTGIWRVPEQFHAPIRQDAVLLLEGESSTAARLFLEFLRSDKARAVIRASGYGVD
ncbi:molybdate ABC transporter substrate-binding protein [Devosia submarina]|uniref:molybdate ABC transporter substrate-binding protein n=1 Tax=Devosia submarina TaxID=1173082 RepID=UPI000D357CFC|nr:molybdate ABC transporter substrate-binding protein [Devosia submarina]